ncbi:MAG: hypothetical protein ACR9NN_01395 [Nostochopsis sp.]
MLKCDRLIFEVFYKAIAFIFFIVRSHFTANLSIKVFLSTVTEWRSNATMANYKDDRLKAPRFSTGDESQRAQDLSCYNEDCIVQ